METFLPPVHECTTPFHGDQTIYKKPTLLDRFLSFNSLAQTKAMDYIHLDEKSGDSLPRYAIIAHFDVFFRTP
jgi:hypothetical protein